MSRVLSRRSLLLQSVAVLALTSSAAFGQTQTQINAGNLLNPFTTLRSSGAGMAVLTNNINTAFSTNTQSTSAQRLQALIDNTITTDNGIVLADGFGSRLFGIFNAANSQAANGSTVTFSTNFQNLLRQINGLSQSDSGFVKNYFANGSTNGFPTNTPAVGISLPAGGQFNIYDSQYNPSAATKNLTGDSRPFQVSPTSIQSFSGVDYFGVPTSNTAISASLGSNASAPSGHTTFGYTTSILMGMLAPERFQQFLTRASEYGNSRIVLGVHYPLDIIMGRTLATYDIVQALNNNPAYLNQTISVFAVGNVTTTNDFQALFNSARSDLTNFLQAGCGGLSVANCSATSTADRFSSYAQDKTDYNFRLTYGLGSVGPTNLAPVVPTGAEVLLSTRFPYLSADQRRDVLATTELASGGPLDTTNPQFAGYSRLNLFAAADGYGAFNGPITVTMNAAAGGFNAFDAWNNNITDGTVQTGAGGNVVGSLTKEGTGTLVLTGANSYTGGTTVNGGSLLLSNSQPGITATVGTTLVNAGGTFGGIGTAGPVTVNGGTLTSGTPMFPGGLTAIFANGQNATAGTLNVQGALALGANANYLVQATAAAASKTIVTGAATVSPSSRLTVNFAPGVYTVGSRVAVLTTAPGGLTGTFSGLAFNSTGINVTPLLSYDAQDAFLTYKQAAIAALPTGSSANANNVANGLNGVINAGGSLPVGLQGIYSSPLGVTAALEQLAGQPGLASNQVINRTASNFLQSLVDQAPDAPGATGQSGGALGYASSPEAERAYAADLPRAITKAPPLVAASPWSVRGQVFGGAGRIDGDPSTGAAQVDSTVFGGGAAADYRANANTVFGMALTGGETRSDLSAGGGSANSTFIQGAVYAKYWSGGFDFSAAIGGGAHDVHTERTVTAGAVPDTLRADYTAGVIAGRAETGYRFDYGFAGLRPYAAVQVQNVSTPNYTETGTAGGAAALAFADRSQTDTRSELGAWIDRSLGEGAVAKVRAAWVHDFNRDSTIQATFQALPAASFVVNGARAAQDAALVSAMVDFRLARNVSFSAKFDGEFGDNAESYAGTGTLRYTW